MSDCNGGVSVRDSYFFLEQQEQDADDHKSAGNNCGKPSLRGHVDLLGARDYGVLISAPMK